MGRRDQRGRTSSPAIPNSLRQEREHRDLAGRQARCDGARLHRQPRSANGLVHFGGDLGAYKEGADVAIIGWPASKMWRTPKGIEVFGPRHFGFDFDYVPIESRRGGPARQASGERDDPRDHASPQRSGGTMLKSSSLVGEPSRLFSLSIFAVSRQPREPWPTPGNLTRHPRTCWRSGRSVRLRCRRIAASVVFTDRPLTWRETDALGSDDRADIRRRTFARRDLAHGVSHIRWSRNPSTRIAFFGLRDGEVGVSGRCTCGRCALTRVCDYDRSNSFRRARGLALAATRWQTARVRRHQRTGPVRPHLVVAPGSRNKTRTSFSDNRRAHIFLVPAAGGQLPQLTSGDFDEHSIDWVPTGLRDPVRVEPPARSGRIAQLRHLCRRRRQKGDTATHGQPPAWRRHHWVSPDGQWIAYLASTRA